MARTRSRTRVQRLLVTISASLLVSAAVLPAAVAEEGDGPVVAPVTPPNVSLVLQSVECESFDNVEYNTPGAPDDTFGSRPDGDGAQQVSTPIGPMPMPEGCNPSAGTFFTLDTNEPQRTDDGSVATYTFGDGAATVGPTLDDGTFLTSLEDILGAAATQEVIDGNTVAWVSAVPREGYAFAALHCHTDAVNDDNLEFIGGIEDENLVYCTAWHVVGSIDEEETPEVPEEETPTPPAPTPPAPPVVEVLAEQVIQRDQQTVTASGPEGSSGSIELDFGDEVDADVDASLSLACEALASEADPSVRLSPELFVVVPSGFDAGDEVIVTTSIDAEDVQQEAPSYAGLPTGDLQIGPAPADPSFDTPELQAERLAAIRTNRGLPLDPDSDLIWLARFAAGTHTLGDARTALSAKAFYWSAAAYGVCFAGEKADPGDLTGLEPFGDTGLFGPVLLPTCSDEVGAPCVSERNLTDDGAVELVSRIPAEDPWMR